MKILILLLIFISCEEPTDNNSLPDGFVPEDTNERIELSDSYNFNGHDYTVESLMVYGEVNDCEFYADGKLYTCKNHYTLTRDDGEIKITVRTYDHIRNGSETYTSYRWQKGGYSNQRESAMTITDGSLEICYQEEVCEGAFYNCEYEDVCDVYRSVE